jgi:Synergist-CTERM protein sorting domain-containing protein
LAVLLLLAAWAGCAHAETEAKAFPPVTWTVTDASDNPSSPGENTLRGIIGKATDQGYVLAERGVQFEIKPGQPLPDGVVPPDFYEDGEGLMTWRNVVADNGPYDHNRQLGVVTFRVASIRAEAQTAPTGGSGCSAGGFSPFALLLGAPLALLRMRRR